MENNYIVRGLKEDGQQVFYTGRAGQGFVSPSLAEAFAYRSVDEARRRALNLNKMTALHGLRFQVPTGDLYGRDSWNVASDDVFAI